MNRHKKDDQQKPGQSDQKKKDKVERKAIKEAKKRKKQEQKRDRRRYSSGELSRVRPSVVDGVQQSHLVRNLVPTRLSDETAKPVAPPVRYVVNMPDNERDHHEAAEAYFRRTPFLHLRESLFHMRRPLGIDFRHRDHRHKKLSHEHAAVQIHPQRCHHCLEINKDCICDTLSDHPPKSDWAVLVQPQFDEPKIFVERRLDWLEDLEKKSPVGLNDIAEGKFDKDHEICCFPFNTFRIFSRQDIENFDFYKKNAEASKK